MIVVTGGAGFIGSNIVRALNQRGEKNIIIVDELTDGTKFKNMVDLQIADYLDKDDFLQKLSSLPIRAIFHEGACSATTEWNGRFMMQNNYEYSKTLLHHCLKQKIPFIYASSAAVYGGNMVFKEEPANEAPLNVYGYSKLLFDNYVRQLKDVKSQVVGLRYFNVYGPREQHKGSMASVAWHCHQQIQAEGKVKLFEGSGGYENGGQRRDFVYVGDVAKVNLWLLDHPKVSGIFNVGTGRSQPFKDVANAVLSWHKHGEIVYIPFPEHLKGRYQNFTEADISALRQAGYTDAFCDVAHGVKEYLDLLAV